MYQKSSDAQLMKAVAKKDHNAFKVLMQRYQQRVYRAVYRFTGDAETARDLTQDIFLKLYRSAPHYSPDAQLFTWIYRIIANHCFNFAKKQRRDPVHNYNSDYSDGQLLPLSSNNHENQHNLLEKEERALMVRRALDSLPERQKLAILLLRFEGLRYSEIAKVMGCSVSAVESLIFRGMGTLKKNLSTKAEIAEN